MFEKRNIKDIIIEWNVNFPVDRWWREKHNVAFMSSVHREISFLDQLFEYEEEKLFNQLKKTDYTPNIGEWLPEPEIGDETQDEFIKRMKSEAKTLFKENG